MKSFKKLLAVVLSLAMVLGTLTVTASAAVTEISDFAGLQSALTSTAGGEYKLTADISATATVETAAAVNITIDLNGYNIIESGARQAFKINNNTNLTVKGSGTITGKSTAQPGAIFRVYSGATLTIDGPTLTGGTSKYDSKSTTSNNGNGGAVYNMGTFNFASGSITGNGSTTKNGGGVYNNGTFNMTGGTISGNTASNNGENLYSGSSATNNISGGSFGADASKKSYYSYNTETNNISGGDFLGSVAGSSSAKFKITGGWFSAQPTASWIAEGYRWKADTTTKPGYAGQVVEGTTPKVAEVTIDGTTEKYETFDAAVEAANVADTTSTIKLIEDCVKTTTCTTVAATTNITLDLNGKTLTNTATYSDVSNYRLRYFTVAGTFTIKDTSVEQTGTIYANNTYTGSTGAITYANPGKVYITGGNYYEGAAQGESTNNCFANTSTGTHIITDGWFSENAKPTYARGAKPNYNYVPEGYHLFSVDDESKSATPYTVSNTTKTINYLKNGGSGTDVSADTYAYKAGYTKAFNVKSLSFTKVGFTCVGWSTDQNADPDGDNIIGSGEAVNFADETKYPDNPEHKVDLYAIYKKVDPTMWVCVDTQNPTIGYADIAAAFASSSDVTLIKNFNGRTTIEVAKECRLNLNGYNITANTAEDPTGSAIVVKVSSGPNGYALSIFNEDAEIAAYPFGGEGKVEGYAQKTGGAIDVIGSVGAIVKIYGGTFTGDAKDHGTVLTNSTVGKTYIYGGTFIPADPESTVDALYANDGKIFVMAENQSDVKIQGVMAKGSGIVGIVGGYFSDLQPAATVGTYDDVNDVMKVDSTKSLIKNTGDETYPYSVGAKPWYITYNLNGGENAAENPSEVAKTDSSVITLQPATKTGYTFDGWTDADGNPVTTITGTELQADLKLTANFTINTYKITYDNMYDAATPELTSYTVEDDVTIPTPTRNAYIFAGWKVEDKEGEAITGWNKGEKTGDIKLWATWSAKEASVTIGGTTTYYLTFAEAIAAVKNCASKATLTLRKDVDITARQTLSSKGTTIDITLDLNGKTLTDNATGEESGVFLYDGAFTITGKGGITNNCTAMKTKSIVAERKDATLTIDSTGTFTGFTAASSNASSTEPGAGATITAGTYSFNPSTSIDAYHYTSKKTVEEVSTWTVNTCAATITAGEETAIKKYMTGTNTEKKDYALDNVTEGCTLTLLKDASASFEFQSAISFTLDMNGFQYKDIATNLTAASPLGVDVKLVEDDVYTVTVAEYSPYKVYVEGQETQNFTTLPDAVAAVLAAGEKAVELKFFEATTITERITLRDETKGLEDTTARNVTINLNEKTLTKGAEIVGMFFANKEATVTVKNGTLDAGTYKGSYFGGNACQYYAYDLTCVNGASMKASAPKLTIYSGSYNVDPSDYLAEGLVAAQNAGKTMFNLSAAAASISNAKGYTNYAYMNSTSSSAKSVLPNIKDGDTVKLWKNASASYTFDKVMTFTLDKNSFEYDLEKYLMVPEYLNISTELVQDETDVYTVAITTKDPTHFEVTSVGGSISESLGLTIYVTSTKAKADLPTLTFDQGNGTESVTATAMSSSNIKYYYRINGIHISNIDVDLGIKIGDDDLQGNIQSVLDYYNQLAELELEKAEAKRDAKLLNLLADTVTFAHELQKSTSKTGVFTPEEWVATYATTVNPETTVKACTVAASDGTKNKIKSASALVNDKVQLIFYVYAADITTKKVELDVNGTKILVSLDTEGVTKTSENDVYRVTLYKIAPKDYSTTYTAQLFIDDVADHAVTYSVNSYCNSMQGSTAAAGNTTAGALAKALYRFGTSYVAYDTKS